LGESKQMKSNLARWIATAAKFAVAMALLVWLSRRGNLSLTRLEEASTHWPELLAILGIFYLEAFVCAWRWNLLLAAQELSIGLSESVSLTMIGFFFNTVIPGAVGGDVIKGYYLSRRMNGKKSAGLTTILMDRLIGLFGLVLLAAGASFWTLRSFESNHALELLRWFALAAAAGGIAALTVAVMASGRLGILDRGESVRWLAPFVKASRSLAAYRQNPEMLLLAVGASIFNHLLSCLAFYLAFQIVGGGAIPWGYYFLLVPLGMITTVIPLSPAGVGVGQAAFFALFQIVPGHSGAAAANAFTIFQILLILVYLSGVYSYLTYRRTAEAEVPAGVISG